jgi:pimeloyl-ACP methyl ester carboxylesterase
LRGHGASEGRDRIRWHSIADYVSDVAQVAGQLSRSPVVIGHSMGGFTVQKYKLQIFYIFAQLRTVFLKPLYIALVN